MKKWLVPLWIVLSVIPEPGLAQGSSTLHDEKSIRRVAQRYAEAWLKGDEAEVMALFEDDAIIVPSGSGSLKGIRALKAYWFPDDSSRTAIHIFTNEILEIFIEGDMAQSSQKTFLSWSYEKETTKISKDQWGFAMTIYRRQTDGAWRIWRHMWTDVRSMDK